MKSVEAELKKQIETKSTKASVATALHRKSNKKEVEEWQNKAEERAENERKDVLEQIKVEKNLSEE